MGPLRALQIVPVCAVALWALLPNPCHAQLRIVSYNVNASDASLTAPRPGVGTILAAIGDSAKAGFSRPIDVLCLQEANSVNTTGSQFVSFHAGKWASCFLAKTDYNYGFNEWCFREIADRDLFLTNISMINWGEHYPKVI